MRAMLPSGFMVEKNTGGIVSVQLCLEDGVQNVRIDLKTGAIAISEENGPSQNPSHDNLKKHPLCPYAGQPAVLAAGSTPHLDAPQRIAIETRKTAISERRSRLWAERPWPTGPPLIS